MYIEVRKNAFYLKKSVWDKETKKTKSSSIYLGSDYNKAKFELELKVGADSPLFQELSKVQESYAYNRAILTLKKLWLELGQSKAGSEVYELYKKLTKAQKYSAENLRKLEEKGQTVLSVKTEK